jgi:hypothetical protein
MKKITLTIPAPTIAGMPVGVSVNFDGFLHPVPAVNILEVTQTLLAAANGLLQALAQETVRAYSPEGVEREQPAHVGTIQ